MVRRISSTTFHYKIEEGSARRARKVLQGMGVAANDPTERRLGCGNKGIGKLEYRCL